MISNSQTLNKNELMNNLRSIRNPKITTIDVFDKSQSVDIKKEIDHHIRLKHQLKVILVRT